MLAYRRLRFQRNLVDIARYCVPGKLRMSEKHDGGTRAHPNHDDAVRVKHTHHIRPDSAALMSPQNPWDGLQFRVAGFGRPNLCKSLPHNGRVQDRHQ